ncbi:DNA internalization-related competence protein ComEC/Rec2 [Desulfuromonas carbonis]|uniref:DNA internalization-related competence protein ComEC/Rec2 n=1 Tax=Desulfuromonas sp. DDH964 TaxID=1823759 RepID=UPI00078BBB8C|nr:DNA internalization-related competence protein ComEC/Rec2 [Desulfuromonas sp. DDH964]AMV71733.1 ComEC-like competence protein [Desulfuromonas sp. DDH964]
MALGLPVLLAAYASGLLAAPYLFPAPWFPFLPLLAGGLWLAWPQRRLAPLLLLLCFSCLGLVRYQLQLQSPTGSGHVAAWVGEKPLRVTGRVERVMSRPEQRSVIDLEAHTLTVAGQSRTVRGIVRIFLDSPPEAAAPGREVSLWTRLRKPRDFGTPGEFAYRRHLAREGIFVTAYLPGSEGLAVLAGDRPDLSATIARWRLAAAAFMDSYLPPEEGILARALLIGDQGGFSAELRERLAACGLSHLFAISGMHLGFLAGFLYLAARAFYRRSSRLLLWAPPRRVLPLALLPLLGFYLVMSGGALATSRAFLIAVGAALYLALSRTLAPLRTLAAAAMILLLLDPLAIFEPGFQLSFAGAAGLLVLLPPWQERLRSWSRPWRWGATLFLASLAATLATLPLAVAHFYRFAPVAPISNLLAVPLIALVALPCGLAALLLAPLALPPAVGLLKLSGLATSLALSAGEALAGLPWLSGRVWYPTPATLVGISLLVIAVGLAGHSRRWRRSAFLVAAAGILVWSWPVSAPGGMRLTALSVGQSEALLLTLPGGENLLIDGGGSRDPHIDIGKRLVAPALARLGVQHLDAVLLTHPHPDHSGGLQEVLATFPVAELWAGPGPEDLPAPLARLAAERQIPRRRFAPGWQQLATAPGLELDLYCPPAEVASANDRSLVLYARQGKRGLLLTGDLGAAGIRRLLSEPLPGPVDLLKIPHHGSRHSAPELLMQTLHPAQALVSVGAGNSYRFPDPVVLAALERNGTTLWRTDRDGTVRFLALEDGWQPQRWQRGLFR